MAVSGITEPLQDAFNWLLDLLMHPDDIAALAPLIRREISGHQKAGAAIRLMGLSDPPKTTGRREQWQV
ncbi:AraC family transcriptional regulator N-terminal domain-containing protein [Marinobacter koreensis]|uniref:AraC family transcriptional regulator N-terminal domain-containing protein n=1 Tax=Marinobacter koreensis TaxID=335974 RepID=A0ABW0RPJ3_9GAMM